MIRRFNRYELKYVIHASKYRGVAEDLLNFMTPDSYGDKDGFYRVTSLYYDSPALHFYRSKIEGLKFRRKLRVRVYPGNDISSVTSGFVEIKQRMNRTVQKRRLRLPLGEAAALCEGDFHPSVLTDKRDAVVSSEVLYMVRAMHLRPKCVVSYRRQAFMGGRYEQGMRVTFDMQLQGRVHGLVVNEAARNHFFLPPDWYVMEVKVNERIPTWMTSLIAKHNCQIQRVSKYCSALAAGRKRLEFRLSHKENIYG